MLTDEDEQKLKELEEMQAQKQPMMVWQWAAISKLKAAKEPVPKGMEPDDYNTFHRLNIKQWAYQIKLTAEEAAQLRTLNGVMCRWMEIEAKREYEEYMRGPPIEPVASMGMCLPTPYRDAWMSQRPQPQRW
uniref:Uncharacterized protein n=1 Tax=viral metagenome TaxID=1070528 RepID=A0A6C0JI20_9ZZZZ